MPEGAEKMGEQFSGLNMESLIGGPLKAAYDAQAMLAASTVKFIENVGFEAPGTDGTGRVRTETFSFKRGVASENGEGVGTEEVSLKVPLLSIVKIPALGIDEVDIKFDMEVKSSESLEKSSDESGELKDFGMPEGLARILDILATASTPTNIQNGSDVA